MSDQDIWIAIAMMAVLLVIMRILGFALSRLISDNKQIRAFLELLPACALAATIVPVAIAGTPVQIGAAVLCALIAWFTRNILLTLSIGLSVMLIGSFLAPGL